MGILKRLLRMSERIKKLKAEHAQSCFGALGVPGNPMWVMELPFGHKPKKETVAAFKEKKQE